MNWKEFSKGIACMFATYNREYLKINASFLMKVKEEDEKLGLKFNTQKTKILASGPITSWEIDGETVESVRLYFFGLPNHCRW